MIAFTRASLDERRRDVRTGDTDATQALLGARTGKSALARQLGVHRDTIHRWIRAGVLDRDLLTESGQYGPRSPVATKLDAYKGIIEARLAVYPGPSAVRLLAEIRARGTPAATRS